MDTFKQRQPAGRRMPRPSRVEHCTRCQAVLGLHYRECPPCYDAIEGLWEADWSALLEREQIVAGSEDEALLAQVVLAEFDDHPWTIVDMAMGRVRCEECNEELGGGPVECESCKFAFGNLWWHDTDAMQQGAMTANEHALRVGRYVMRHPHRYSRAVATGWRMNMPRLMAGWLPKGSDMRRTAKLLKDGHEIDCDAMYREIDANINQGKGCDGTW
ncbi:MAG: hypothetical protein HC828_01230 [Blastochloris sp.]|nr:hypothetical protein [Blastochloris sp.]